MNKQFKHVFRSYIDVERFSTVWQKPKKHKKKHEKSLISNENCVIYWCNYGKKYMVCSGNNTNPILSIPNDE